MYHATLPCSNHHTLKNALKGCIFQKGVFIRGHFVNGNSHSDSTLQTVAINQKFIAEGLTCCEVQSLL